MRQILAARTFGNEIQSEGMAPEVPDDFVGGLAFGYVRGTAARGEEIICVGIRKWA